MTEIHMEQVLRECCADAAGAGEEIADRVLGVATVLRDGDLETGNAGLTAIAQDLRSFATLLTAIADSPGLERQWLATDTSGPRQQLDHLGGWLGSLVDAQTSADWVTASDILEHDLEPALRRWEQLLHVLAA